MKAADLLVKCLENEGVEVIFGIAGKEILELVNSLAKSTQIQFVPVRHEQGAAFMADVYGRLAGKAGVCLSTLGPGATNLLTGVSSAQLDHSPLIALIGQADVSRHRAESHQYINIPNVFEPVTKGSTQIVDPQTLATAIRKSFKLATIEKPGAAAVILPENVLSEVVTNPPLEVTPLPESVPTGDAVKTAMYLIESCKRPFLLVGNGVVRADAVGELRTLVDTLQSPVSHSFMAKGILETSHPQNYFTFGFSEKDEVLPGIQEADLLIAIGHDFVEKLPSHWNKGKLPVLHIDSMPAETNEFYPVAAELVGNIKITLQLLNQSGLPAKSWKPAGNLREVIMKAYQVNQQKTPSSHDPVKIEYVLQIIQRLSPDDAILISDVGAHKISIARTYQPKLPNRTIISNGLATMGIAIPGCLGAKLACPDSTVVAITGDGGALMNFAEIETASRLGLSFLIIVINDSMLKLEVKQMEKKFGETHGVTFQNPDFVKMADSYDITGKRAATLGEFEMAFQEFLSSSDGITLIELVM
ncbi:acetolactate synthase large subunit [Neobacillus notoginsengisoli]|uniref:Acetolactate synthase large subunit n=1 Tax=Neobacillus notoginsengisoli TaxID=1578198 RepID=A0A417YZG8_9BACI|nr:acetolactate synthase large subunit [Neobacillus notoginsengisoli]RHW43293.1 acetolactate synthase large subunit [Neobacillus notoginsengisoli]